MYDIIIIEDDPYWYLQYPSANSLSLTYRGHRASNDARPGDPHHYKYSPAWKPGDSALPTASPPKSSGYPFLDSLVPSYLSVDYQGRVVRLDTFSKTVAPGCRLGWITTQPALCERLLRITETSTQQPSGFVQSMIAELILGPQNQHGRGGGQDDKGWNVDGWVRWLEGLRGNYERRMNTMCTVFEEGRFLVKSVRRKSWINNTDDDQEGAVVDKHEIYAFTYPLGGMFVWLRMHFENHPLWRKVGAEKLAHACWVYLTTPKYLVLVAPGWVFAPTEEIRREKSWAFFRVCFAAVDEGEVEKMSQRFVAGVQSFWGKKSVEEVEGLCAAGEEMMTEGLVDLRGGC